MMDIQLEVGGVLDRRVTDAIRRCVRAVRGEFAASGEWRVAVSQSERRGEWNVGVRAPSGWHLDSFTGAEDGLPVFVERRLREYVERVGATANAG